MGKNNRTEVIKVLRQQMEEATDPQAKVGFAKQIAKLLPRPRQARRPRRTETTPSNKPRSLREIYTGSVYDEMTDGEVVLHHLIVEIEKRQRAGELQTKAERAVFIAEVVRTLLENERAAFEALNAEDV